jgi:toxin ParE1/3/4
MKVVFHRGALRDVEGIQSYIARDNPRAAGEVVARIKTAADRLMNSPLMGRPGPRRTRLLSIPGLPYVLIHRVDADTVSIVAVFHTSRNRRF